MTRAPATAGPDDGDDVVSVLDPSAVHVADEATDAVPSVDTDDDAGGDE